MNTNKFPTIQFKAKMMVEAYGKDNAMKMAKEQWDYNPTKANWYWARMMKEIASN